MDRRDAYRTRRLNMKLQDIAVGRSDLLRIDPRKIVVDPSFNVRADTPELQEHIATLARSISEIGVQKPLTVRLHNDAPYLVDGHCRLQAALLLGDMIQTVPCLPEGRGVSEADRTLMLLTQNSGMPLTPLEKAAVFSRLLGYGWSEADIARKAGYSVQHVRNLLDLNAAPSEVLDMVRSGEVSATLAIQEIKTGNSDRLISAVRVVRTEGGKRVTARTISPPKAELSPDECRRVLTDILSLQDVETIHALVRDYLSSK